MSIGSSAVAPLGHRLFCKAQPNECRTDTPAPAERLELEPEIMKTIAEINTAVNQMIRPVSDQIQFGVEEHWTYPDNSGDCEDYALLKRRKLHAAGIALSDLLITVVRKANGEGHAILTLTTTSGDYVLDNLDWRVRPWREAPYTYLKRQSSDDPEKWQTITADTDVLVSAVAR
ncbi:transglutaminase-like cysteine peptidase [Aureimonas sp. SA4125]|uniref:transglutaminase-like cysteine peptidase n=1 Tax=Aureimonas sp. SA4125 TaxID=2826993 RepID=UPI001CC5C5C2|nr:transglutaminase-like cysteine peptidase [Aureimonas sp. SA4125]